MPNGIRQYYHIFSVLETKHFHSARLHHVTVYKYSHEPWDVPVPLAKEVTMVAVSLVYGTIY